MGSAATAMAGVAIGTGTGAIGMRSMAMAVGLFEMPVKAVPTSVGRLATTVGTPGIGLAGSGGEMITARPRPPRDLPCC